jgi:putative transposase
VYFNLAHSREQAIVAIATSRRVGVDIEDVSQPREIDALVRRRTRKRIAEPRGPFPTVALVPNDYWSLDFMSDVLATGRRFRTLGVIDTCTREALAIEVDTSLPSARVVRVLERLIRERGHPSEIVLDNGPELISQGLDQWTAEHGIKLGFIEPGKPVQNAVMESFNGRFRDECLNSHWFTSLADARQIIETWRLDYNQVRPHSSLGYHTPTEVHQQFTESLATMDAAGFS